MNSDGNFRRLLHYYLKILEQIGRIPVVPEVSVVENSFFTHLKPRNPHNSTVRPQNNDNPYMNLAMNNHNKKHVRFKNGCPHSNSTTNFVSNEKENAPLKSVPDLNGKTFEQIYMANVPDRHLDLSIFEPPNKEPKPCDNLAKFDKPPNSQVVQEEPKPCDHLVKFNKFSYSHARNYDTNILKSIENTPPFQLPKESVVGKEIAKPTEEPTIKDLFNIIQQQNEQIMLLQREVTNLKSSIRQAENDPIPPIENAQEMRNSPKKGLFSIDFQATSFEVSFRPPHGKFRKQNDFLEPKIQEIVECDSNRDNQDISLHLEESLHVKDSYMSAVPSIQINMDEYQSSDEEESVNIGLTFYKDLMDQVNNVLKKMQAQSECQISSNKKTGQTMTAVKQATLQHLKSIGVNLSPIQETNEMTEGSDLESKNFDSSEVSFAVKQLLMKYLPDDKLTKALNKQKEQPTAHVKEKKKFKKPPGSEFSFATLQYLKKYNIIDNSRKLPELDRRPTGQDTPKILDVTALKRQPKLL
ncbi:uncharacterized protein BDFB_006259 [Asbolus verrucosus]|uniref:Uncharacterized protein n=1 Tax=Asbolus verrucosus TaxID=1661398 RepID=A0A482VD19_ASBVE|nr:uncharacterized protein BDFB_006259 [Asbolus verrucosus]